MKKTLRVILISLAVVLGIFIVISVVFMLRFSSVTKSMSPAETMAINDSVFCINDRFVNSFIFKGNPGYLMVDACMSRSIVEAELDKLGISPDKITTILLTHSDGDHIGALDLFGNASVYLHTEEEQMINGQNSKGFVKFKWKYGDYKVFKSDEVLNLEGLNIKVHHTPGHTPGSTCFSINSDYLVTGDNLIYSEGKYLNFIESVNMDTEEQEESLKTLPEPTNFKYILTAHNGITEVKPR